jgi:voltage-gated potassium channel
MIIARADFEEGEKKLIRAGADQVVIPHVLGGIRMAMASLRPNVVDFMQIAAVGEEGLSLEEVVIPTESKLVGKTVLDSNLKNQYGVTIIGIKRGGEKMTLNPEPGTVLGAGDILILIGRVEQLELLNHSVKL